MRSQGEPLNVRVFQLSRHAKRGEISPKVRTQVPNKATGLEVIMLRTRLCRISYCSAYKYPIRPRCPIQTIRGVCGGRIVRGMGRAIPTPPCSEIPLASCYVARASNATSCFPLGDARPVFPVLRTGRTPWRVRMSHQAQYPSVSLPIPALCWVRSPTPALHGRHLRGIGLSSTGRDARFCPPCFSREDCRFRLHSLSGMVEVRLRVAPPLACLVAHRVSHSTEGQRRYTEKPNKAMQPMTALRRLGVIRESVVGQSWLILCVRGNIGCR